MLELYNVFWIYDRILGRFHVLWAMLKCLFRVSDFLGTLAVSVYNQQLVGVYVTLPIMLWLPRIHRLGAVLANTDLCHRFTTALCCLWRLERIF